jgi:Fe-S cluster assembly iron-binding protein IscA
MLMLLDEDGEPVLQDGVQVVIKGLKSQKIQYLNNKLVDYLHQQIGM